MLHAPRIFCVAKIRKKENRMNTNPETIESESAVLARVLDDMRFLGLIELKPDEDRKVWSFTSERKPHQAEDQNNTSKKVAYLSKTA